MKTQRVSHQFCNDFVILGVRSFRRLFGLFYCSFCRGLLHLSFSFQALKPKCTSLIAETCQSQKAIQSSQYEAAGPAVGSWNANMFPARSVIIMCIVVPHPAASP